MQIYNIKLDFLFQGRNKMKKVFLIALFGILLPTSVVFAASDSEPVNKTVQITPAGKLLSKKAVAEVIDPKDAIAKTLENVIEFQRISLGLNDKQNAEAVKKLTEQQSALSVSLYNSGIFKIFTPLDWMQNEAQEGKIFVALIYLQKYPQYATPKTVERIKQIAQNPSLTLKPTVDATLKIYDDYAKKHPYS